MKCLEFCALETWKFIFWDLNNVGHFSNLGFYSRNIITSIFHYRNLVVKSLVLKDLYLKQLVVQFFGIESVWKLNKLVVKDSVVNFSKPLNCKYAWTEKSPIFLLIQYDLKFNWFYRLLGNNLAFMRGGSEV